MMDKIIARYFENDNKTASFDLVNLNAIHYSQWGYNK